MSARRTLTTICALTVALLLAGCSSDVVGGDPQAASGHSSSSSPSPTPTPVSVAKISSSINRNASDVAIDRPLRVHVRQGTLRQVRVTTVGGPLPGTMSPDRTTWHSTARLQPGQAYAVHGVAVDAEGLRAVYRSTFHTKALTLDEQTFPSFVPTDGATVGVGMPVIVRFDVPVTDHAAIQRHLHVTSTPAQPGAWRWLSDQEVHWRPKTYWRAGTTVKVDADIDSIPAGNGIFGQKSRSMTFHVGRSMISKVDTRTDQMRVFENGQLIRTIPITTGRQPKFTTRSGIKVIVEKFRHHRMNSETIGIDPNSADGYDLDDVEFAMRLTYSGEFLHAAPWSVASQGHENVSHGCTGMSTENAGWLYERTLIGDVVEYTGTDRQMTMDNGYGDWNSSFADYARS